ncbi:MAG: response regulator [Anaerolineales bacterium]
MNTILIIDDETTYHTLIKNVLDAPDRQFYFASSGEQGLSLARQHRPSLIITDVMMPGLNGYEVTRTLRRDPMFAATPILVLTAQAGLQDKIKSFEAGADDHLTKPFNAEEFAARVAALLRRAEALQSQRIESPLAQEGRMIAVHSLRGGTGCSSLAVNLGVGLFSLWKEPTILLDLTMTAGQVALMLNMTLRRTWLDIAGRSPDDLDETLLASIIGRHESGLHFIAAPTFPAEAETLSGETLGAALKLIKANYAYIVADLPHDFSDPALQALDLADQILITASPDMASVRAVAAAIDTYQKLGYPPEKFKFILNATFPHSGLTKEKIEAALGLPATMTIPYVQDVFVDAINMGRPVLYDQPESPLAAILEDFAFFMSKETHKKTRPENPSEAWKRVYKRYQERSKKAALSK